MAVEGVLQDPLRRHQSSRSASTSGVITPRSSTIKGDCLTHAGLFQRNLLPGRNPLSRFSSRAPAVRATAQRLVSDSVYHLDMGQQRAQTGDAPAVARVAKCVPVVYGYPRAAHLH